MELAYILDEADMDVRLFRACQNGDTKTLKKLASAGADLNWQKNNWKTAPIHAAVGGSTPCLKILIESGADIEVRESNDLTPLMLACHGHTAKHRQHALLLIAAGADVNAVRISDEITPLKFAKGDYSGSVIAALISAGAKIDGVPNDGFTPLMHFARANNSTGIELLLRAGADASTPCRLKWANGATAEQLAKMENRTKALLAFQIFRNGQAEVAQQGIQPDGPASGGSAS